MKQQKKQPKLVRDKIPEIIKSDGRKCRTRVANDKEYHQFLLKKIDEEILELKHAKNKDEKLNELADVLEVLHAIAAHHNIDKKELEQKRKLKIKQRGNFSKKIILEDW